MRTRFKVLLPLLLLSALPAVVHAQFTFTTNSGAITITKYTGSGGAVVIPSTINGYPVTSIGDYALEYTSVTSLTIGNNVTYLGLEALAHCNSLRGIYFRGNAPGGGTGTFQSDVDATLYYLPGTTGWAGFVALFGPAYYDRLPVVLWNPQAQTSGASFGVRTNRFGFNITGTSSLVIVVEACTNLANPTWSPVATNTLTGGSCYFSDPQWTNYAARFYRLRSP
jgi:hypothetical protein